MKMARTFIRVRHGFYYKFICMRQRGSLYVFSPVIRMAVLLQLAKDT